ncbi:MAG: hypothetical protein FK733_15380, partial [Asgard group archaeon]|nr:hypothetical protein [Asgard group archaeon]
ENPSRETILDVLFFCKERGIKICFDPNIRLDLWDNEEYFRTMMDVYLSLTDIFYPSKEELLFILNDNTLNEQEAIDKLMDKYPIKIVALKLGKDGCLIKKRDDFFLTIPSFEVPVIDTTGAGDGFNAGFIFALTEELSLEEAGIIGNAVGALVIQKKGAMTSLPTRFELVDFLMKQQLRINFGVSD